MALILFTLTHVILTGAEPNGFFPDQKGRSPLFPYLQEYVRDFNREFARIPEERRHRLDRIASDLRRQQESGQTLQVFLFDTFQETLAPMVHLWLEAALRHSGLGNIGVFSGGLLPEKLNQNALQALERAGFIIYRSQTEGIETFRVRYAYETRATVIFSKKFDFKGNPRQRMYVIVLDEHAELNLPAPLQGPSRLSLLYHDPGSREKDPEVFSAYDRLCRQIALEMFYLAHRLGKA
jgi:hypothetical protein